MNTAELDRVLEHCAANPAQHDQDVWFDYMNAYENMWIDDDEGGVTLAEGWQRHVAACVAGWTAILNGWRPIHPESHRVTNDAGQVADVVVVARGILGFTADQAVRMFAHAHQLTEVRRLAQTFAEEVAR